MTNKLKKCFSNDSDMNTVQHIYKTSTFMTWSWMRVSHDNNLRWISWYIITINQLIVKSNLVLWLLWVKKKNTNLNHCDYVKLGSFLTL